MLPALDLMVQEAMSIVIMRMVHEPGEGSFVSLDTTKQIAPFGLKQAIARRGSAGSACESEFTVAGSETPNHPLLTAHRAPDTRLLPIITVFIAEPIYFCFTFQPGTQQLA